MHNYNETMAYIQNELDMATKEMLSQVILKRLFSILLQICPWGSNQVHTAEQKVVLPSEEMHPAHLSESPNNMVHVRKAR